MRSPINVDIMIDGRWHDNIRLKVKPLAKYSYKRLKEMVCKARPSLSGTDFEIVPFCRPVLNHR